MAAPQDGTRDEAAGLQAPGWTLTQPEPGVMHWTTPAGRSYTTRPTVYEQ
jgi:hypothetical protein